jgi:hypothetical protein
MALYVRNGTFCLTESGIGTDELAVVGGVFTFFSSGTDGPVIYSGSVGRFSVDANLKQPSIVLVQPYSVSAGRFSTNPAINFSQTFKFTKKNWAVQSSSGTSAAHLTNQGFGRHDPLKAILQVGVFVSSWQGVKAILSRADHVPIAQPLSVGLPDDVKRLLRVVNDLAETLALHQKQRNTLSSDPVAVITKYLQSLLPTNDVRVKQSITVSLSEPGSLFKSVQVGIYIDGRPL